MHFPSTISALSFSIFSLITPIIAAEIPYLPTQECPLLGPTFSPDFNLTSTTAFINATQQFPHTIQSLLDSQKVTNTTSFTISVFSTHTNTSVYTYTHTATNPILNETITTGSITDETIFRIGSVSKLFTVYAILLAGGGGVQVLDRPVVDYLPELRWNTSLNGTLDGLRNVRWEEVTIGALASQQAGVGNFPSDSVICLPTGNDTCIADFLTAMREVKVPVQPVFQSAQYSDGGFGVLGRVLERMTGLVYNDAIQTVLAKPLGLKHTGSFEPDAEGLDAIVIPGGLAVSAWGFDNQVTAPSGGLYSTTADLRTLALSILNSTLLPPSTTRAWLKPHAHTSSLTTSIGAPWEIYRLTLPVSPSSPRSRVSDLYTKGGGQPGYTAILALSPDHGIGYSVLVAGAGASGDRWPLRAAAGEIFIPAAEHAGWENAKENSVGTFPSSDVSGSNLTLTVDEDKLGLGLSSFFIQGIEVRANLLQPGFVVPEGREVVVRVYPTGLESEFADGKKVLKYRTVAELAPLEGRAIVEGGEGLFDDACISWFSAGFWQSPENQALDELLFEVKDGKLVSVSSPAVGMVFQRV